MGNSESKKTFSKATLSKFKHKYAKVGSHFDPNKGKVSIFEKITSKELVSCFGKKFASEDLFFFFEREYRDRILIVSPILLKMKGFSKKGKDFASCQPSTEVKLYEEFHENNLEEQIKVKAYNAVRDFQ